MNQKNSDNQIDTQEGASVMFKKFLQAIAVALVVMMSLEIIPVAAVNEIKDMIEQVSLHESSLLEDDAESSVENETSQVVCEIVSMRQENVKYFLMDNGTYTAAQYGVPVHYKDDNNNWQDIDNTLEYVNSEEFTGYKNKANDFDVQFSAGSRANTLVEISKDSYSLSWKYLPSVDSVLNAITGYVSSANALSEEDNSFAVETVSSEFNIWAWKGDYINLGAGAELGIYYGNEPHWLVDKGLAQPMAMWLSYKGQNIINYTSGGAQWWCTGFNPAYQNVSASDLKATFVIRFTDGGLYNAFRSTWSGDLRWNFYSLQGFGMACLTF